MFFKPKKQNFAGQIILLMVAAAVLGALLLLAVNKYTDPRPDAMAPPDEQVAADPDREAEAVKEANRRAVEDTQKAAVVNRRRAIDGTDHVLGDPEAPVQFIIYDDFECPYCARFSDTVKQVAGQYSDEVVIAFRHFPLRFHANALPAALASECAAEQGEFWAMHDELFAANKAGDMSIEKFKQIAAGLGLDRVEFNKCLDTEKYKDKVNGHLAEGRAAGVTGTPGSFINDRVLTGAVPFEDYTDSRGIERRGLKTIIEDILAQQ